MEAISLPAAAGKSNAVRAILTTGLIAGTMDISAACLSAYLQRGTAPERILQSVASGLLGADSFNGGAKSAALGLFLHFVIAFGWTIVFYLASRKLKFLTKQAIMAGVLYGIFVFWFMQLVVLPLSAFPYKLMFTPLSVVIGMIIHIFCIGLPIALSIRRFSK